MSISTLKKYSHLIDSRGRPIDRILTDLLKIPKDFLNFFINRHRLIVLKIRPINIQARLQATRDAASCGKQIAIPLQLPLMLTKLSPLK